jgi:hypothetical protein
MKPKRPLKGQAIDGCFFLDCRDHRNACNSVCRWRWFRFVFAVVDMIEEKILILEAEIQLLKSALASARAACKDRGITTREFAKMCNLNATVLSMMTSEIPKRMPDLVESKCI